MVAIAVDINEKVYLDILADGPMSIEHQVEVLIIGESSHRLEIEAAARNVSAVVVLQDAIVGPVI